MLLMLYSVALRSEIGKREATAACARPLYSQRRPLQLANVSVEDTCPADLSPIARNLEKSFQVVATPATPEPVETEVSEAPKSTESEAPKSTETKKPSQSNQAKQQATTVPEHDAPQPKKEDDVFYEADDPMTREDQMQARDDMQGKVSEAEEGLGAANPKTKKPKQQPGRPVGRPKRSAQPKAKGKAQSKEVETESKPEVPKGKAKTKAKAKEEAQTEVHPEAKAKGKAKAKSKSTASGKRPSEEVPDENEEPKCKLGELLDEAKLKKAPNPKPKDGPLKKRAKPAPKHEPDEGQVAPSQAEPRSTFAGRRMPPIDAFARQRRCSIRDAFMMVVKPKVRSPSSLEACVALCLVHVCYSVYVCNVKHCTSCLRLQYPFWTFAFENLEGVDAIKMDNVTKKSAETFLTHEVVQSRLAGVMDCYKFVAV